jgi:hypothetical protein
VKWWRWRCGVYRDPMVSFMFPFDWPPFRRWCYVPTFSTSLGRVDLKPSAPCSILSRSALWLAPSRLVCLSSRPDCLWMPSPAWLPLAVCYHIVHYLDFLHCACSLVYIYLMSEWVVGVFGTHVMLVFTREKLSSTWNKWICVNYRFLTSCGKRV